MNTWINDEPRITKPTVSLCKFLIYMHCLASMTILAEKKQTMHPLKPDSRLIHTPRHMAFCNLVIPKPISWWIRPTMGGGDAMIPLAWPSTTTLLMAWNTCRSEVRKQQSWKPGKTTREMHGFSRKGTVRFLIFGAYGHCKPWFL